MQKDPPDATHHRARPVNHTSNSLHPLFDRNPPLRTPPQGSAGNAASVANGSSNHAPAAMRRRQEAERAALRQRLRNDIQRQQLEMRKHKEFLEKTKLWEEQIIPNWDQVQHSNKVRDLCLKGIPPTIRAKVWPLLLGNDLEVDEALFDALNKEVHDTLGNKLTAHRSKMAESYSSGMAVDIGAATAELHLALGNDTPSAAPSSSNYHRPPASAEQFADHTADIPIPKAEEGTGLDITEMPWFENERNGSLDRDAFDLVQRQLLDRPNYLLQRVLKSPMNNESRAAKQRGSFDSATPSTANRILNNTSGYIDPNLAAPFALDDDSLPTTPTRSNRAATGSGASASASNFASATTSTMLLTPQSSRSLQLDGFSTPWRSDADGEPREESPFTPVRRVKHDAAYLINAGLLVEDSGTNDDFVVGDLTPRASNFLKEGLVHHEPYELCMLRQSDLGRALQISSQVSLLGDGNNSNAEEKVEEALRGEEESAGKEGEEDMSPDHARLFAAVALVEWDLPRTFPTLAFFHDGGPMHTGMERILLCYALYQPDIGYVQGMSFLVATLLLCMDEFEAFKCFSNLLNRRMCKDFYCLRKESIDAYARCFDYYFKKLLPLLYNHLRAEGVSSEMFLMDWILSLFTKTLPLEIAAQVWDGYLYEGESYILSVGLGILKMFAAMLSTFTFEKITPFLLHLPEDIKSDDLFNNIAQINISKKHYEKIRKRMMPMEAPAGPPQNSSDAPGSHSNPHSDESPNHHADNLLTKSLRFSKAVLLMSHSNQQAGTAASKPQVFVPAPSPTPVPVSVSSPIRRSQSAQSLVTESVSRKNSQTEGGSRRSESTDGVMRGLDEHSLPSQRASANDRPPNRSLSPSTTMDAGLLALGGPTAGLAGLTRDHIQARAVHTSPSSTSENLTIAERPTQVASQQPTASKAQAQRRRSTGTTGHGSQKGKDCAIS